MNIFQISSNQGFTIVGKCSIKRESSLIKSGTLPPNITASSSSIIVREKNAPGGGLTPFKDGEDQISRHYQYVKVKVV